MMHEDLDCIAYKQPSSTQMTHRPIYNSSPPESTGGEAWGGVEQRNPRLEFRESEDLEPELDDGCDSPYIRLLT